MRPYLVLARLLGKVVAAITDDLPRELTICYEGRLAEEDTSALTVEVVAGLFEGRGDPPLSGEEALVRAAGLGLLVHEVKQRRSRDYVSLILVTAPGEGGERQAGGTVFGPQDKLRLVRVFNQDIDIEPTSHMVFLRYQDAPGMIGKVGTAMGEKGINIAFMNVGRKGGVALMALALDCAVPGAVIETLSSLEGFLEVRSVELQTHEGSLA